MKDKHMDILTDIHERVARIEEHMKSQNGMLREQIKHIDKNTGFRNYMKGAMAGLSALTVFATILAILTYFI